VLLVPKASGFDALVWVLPVAALVCAAAGLAVTFRRWKREADDDVDPTDDDRELVAAALRSESEAPPDERDP
jgi:cytochrome c-type biogenesis protein CcmH/NrfF